jgi:hypothetical protein
MARRKAGYNRWKERANSKGLVEGIGESKVILKHCEISFQHF